MDLAKFRMWVSNHKMPAIVVAAFIAGLACAYLHDSYRPPAPPPASVSETRNAAQSAPETAAAPDEEKDSADAMFDPTDKRTAAKYKVPVQLSTSEVKQLSADAACAQEYLTLWGDIFDDYMKVYDHLDGDQTEIFNRIATGKGFKNEEVPVRYHQIMDSGNISGDFLAMAAVSVPANLRLTAVRHHVIGGECMLGDIVFVKWISALALSKISTIGPSLISANELQQWMEAEGLKDGPFPFSAQKNVLTGYKTTQKYVDEIYNKYHGTAGTRPKRSSTQ